MQHLDHHTHRPLARALALLALLLPLSAVAQQYRLRGVVSDATTGR